MCSLLVDEQDLTAATLNAKKKESVTSQKFQNKTNEFPILQILEPTKTFIQLSLIHNNLS
jgi:hypothetical protein